jgi:hypothetical protein
MNLRWPLRYLRWSYCAFVAAASLVAAQSALQGHGEGSHGAQMILALAVTEAIAAVALLIEPAEVLACSVLILVYLVAGVVSILSDDWLAVLRFIFYAVTVTYIVLASRAYKDIAGFPV